MKKTTLLILFLFGFVSNAVSQASLCEDAVSVSLPFSTTDDTANYASNYSGLPGQSCGTPNNFLSGNDVVYAYTATFTGSINLMLSTDSRYVGLFAYASCEDIGQNCLAGAVMEDSNSPRYLSLEAIPVTNGATYYFVVSSWALPQTVTYHLNITENTCANASAAYTVISDCSVTDQFFVRTNIESLGSAFSVTVSDNQGSLTQNVSDAGGIVTFGPYPNATLVVLTVKNDQDPNCFLTSATQTQFICAPVNNFCDHAIDLSLETSPLNGTTNGATNQNTTSCSSLLAAGDIYYKMVVPNTYTLTIGNTYTDYDAMATMFYGDCDNQIELTCFDDDLEEYRYVNNTGTDQTFYWVQDGFNGQTGAFELNWNLSNCVTPDANYTVVPDCANGEQFLVDADIFSLGSATSITISDDQGNAPQTATETGLFHFGPYPNGTPVVFTATNDDDATCFLISPEVVQYECPPTCTNATVSYNIVLDCPNSGFFIDANVTNLGSATTLILTDDLGISNQTITATGIYQVGPYPDYAGIVFTLANNDDSDCILTNNVQSYAICPPANDSCANPIVLITASDMWTGAIWGTSEGATVSGELPIPTCGNFHFSDYAKDVWYTVAVPASGNITVETASSDDSGFSIMTDSVIQLYSGNCSGLTPISCDNDGGTELYSMVSLSGRTAGEVLYVRAFGANGTQGSFRISAYDAPLATADFERSGVSYFPNPVKDILHLSYQTNMSKVAVFNMLGQEVIVKSVNSRQSTIDMSGLPKGTYLVRATAENQIKTIKIVKE